MNMESNNYFSCEPFAPFNFFTEISEERKEKESLNLSKKNRKKSIKLKINKEIKEDILTPILYGKSQRKNRYGDYLNLEKSNIIRNFHYSKTNFKKNRANIFIYDWDNTLIPTNFLEQENIILEEKLPIEYLEQFSVLEDTVFKLLEFSIENGNTYIITNSSIGWFEFSIYKYFPNLSKLFSNINVISAHDKYKDIYPNNKKLWKQQAFLSLKQSINKKLINNIICFGDSNIELEAGKQLASQISNCFIKTIKFKECPEPDDIIKQINLIFTKLNYIISKSKNLSITIIQNDT